MMRFNAKKVGFGRHETFALRYSWLTKGFQALVEDDGIFTSDDATVRLGVGKNMVNAIKFWLMATRMIEPQKGGAYQATPIGRAIFGENGYDPYLEDEATIWLIHWMIATNPEQATAWYWFFNKFHKLEFSSQEVANALHDFVTRQKIKSAVKTVKNDAAIVLRMYSQGLTRGRRPLEDVLDAPLAQLNLISQLSGGRTFSSVPAEREGLPVGILGYAIAELFDEMERNEVAIKDLVYAEGDFPCPGSVFRMTENAFLTKLEQMILALPGYFELRETAGIHQLYRLRHMDAMMFLQYHYLDQHKEVTA